MNTRTLTCLAGAMAVLAMLPSHAQAPAAVTDITGAEVRQFLAQMPKNEGGDLPIRVVDAGGYRIGVYGVYRPKGAADNASSHLTRVTACCIVWTRAPSSSSPAACRTGGASATGT